MPAALPRFGQYEGWHRGGPARVPASLAPWLKQVTPGWRWDWPHVRHIAAALDRVTRGEVTRLIIEAPVRHGKTELVSVRYPAYRLERDPAQRVILGGYNQQHANRISRKARRIAAGRVALSDERAGVEEWETAAGGGVRAVGVGGGVTGYGGDLVIVDDPIKNRQEAESQTTRDAVWDWFTDDLYTRLEPGAALVVCAARWHEDDLTGRILASESAGEWVRVRLPALAEADDPLGRPEGAALCPDRYDEHALARIKRTIGTYAFSGLFQAAPQPAGGTIFNRAWWRFWRHAPRPPGQGGEPYALFPPVITRRLTSWDMAFKGEADSDYVAAGEYGQLGADIYLEDEVHEQLDFPGTVRAMRHFRARHAAKQPPPTGHYVEDKANGPAIIASLAKEIPGLIPVDNKGTNLLDRARSIQAVVEAGNVYLPDPTMEGYEWVHDFIDELARFPKGKNDDRVAQFVQAVMRLTEGAGASEALQRALTPEPARPATSTLDIRNRRY
jgi:predicted phage terminase large subunit-like protein